MQATAVNRLERLLARVDGQAAEAWNDYLWTCRSFLRRAVPDQVGYELSEPLAWEKLLGRLKMTVARRAAILARAEELSAQR